MVLFLFVLLLSSYAYASIGTLKVPGTEAPQFSPIWIDVTAPGCVWQLNAWYEDDWHSTGPLCAWNGGVLGCAGPGASYRWKRILWDVGPYYIYGYVYLADCADTVNCNDCVVGAGDYTYPQSITITVTERTTTTTTTTTTIPSYSWTYVQDCSAGCCPSDGCVGCKCCSLVSNLQHEPDTVNVGEQITFSADVTVDDPTQLYVCKDSSCTNCGDSDVYTYTKTFYSTTSDGDESGFSHDDRNAFRIRDDDKVFVVGQNRYMLAGVIDLTVIYRSFVFFDTSSIPSNSVITDAKLSLRGSGDYSNTDFNINIQNGQPTYPHDPLAMGDYYYAHYSGNGGNISTSSFSTTDYNDIPLNADGKNWIQKGDGAKTKLALLSSRDINLIAPSLDVPEYVTLYASEQGGDYRPKLTVTYTIIGFDVSNCWCNTSLGAESSKSCSYTTTQDDVETSPNNYWAKACDSNGICSAIIPGDEFTVRGTSSILGNVKNTDNENIEGARIDVIQGTIIKYTADTDTLGDYQIDNIIPGTYDMVASKDGYVSSTETNVNVLSGEVIVNFILVPGTTCEDDCTYEGDNIIYKECDGINGCDFCDARSKEVCDLAQPGWIRNYDENNVVECGEGCPYEKKEVKAKITCEEENLIKITKLVQYKGKLTKLVVVACG